MNKHSTYEVIIINRDTTKRYNFVFSKFFLIFITIVIFILSFILVVNTTFSYYFFRKLSYFEMLQKENKRLALKVRKYQQLKSQMDKLALFQKKLMADLGVLDKGANYYSDKYAFSLDKKYLYIILKKKFYRTFFNYRNEDTAKVEFQWPLRGHISRYFSIDEYTYPRHLGIDIVAKPNSIIVAAADGVVESVGYDKIFGNYIKIYHNKQFSTFYGHNSRNIVGVGDAVKKGQIIAFLGSTGESSGPHLHFGIFNNNKAVDPLKFLY